jgi:hypothetical protein
MARITAEDLKTRGTAAIESALASDPECVISVQGKDRYVVMRMEHYHYLRECELDVAIAESRTHPASSQCVQETQKEH